MFFYFEKIIALIMTIVMMAAAFFGLEIQSKDIVIVYTNDVHCAVGGDNEDNIGYAGVVAFKKEMENVTPYVTLVDVGDAVQGATIGMISKGEYPVDIMNFAGYDYSAVGNHEFDYGMPQLKKLIDKANYTYLCCNVTYSGTEENALENIAPFAIEHYGNTDVAFIGVTTPYSYSTSVPTYFKDENGKVIYGFSDENYYSVIQSTVSQCKRLGAEYVVVMGHTGNGESDAPYGATDIIKNVSGIDIYLSAHDHVTVPSNIVKDKDGNNVVLSSTGTGLENIGKLTISAGGDITATLISNYEEKDADTETYIKGIKSNYEAKLKTVVANNPVDLTVSEGGVRKIRTCEVPLGNFITDAYREATGAQIAICNAGGIRADIKKGNVTFGDIFSTLPFDKDIICVKATGRQIADALEMSYRFVQSEYSNGTAAIGETGGFMQVSGIKFTIDTSVTSSVEEANGEFVNVNGERRVKDIQVLQGDKYVSLDLSAEYTLASTNYVLLQGGDGMNMFMQDEEIVLEALKDYDAVINYFSNHTADFIEKNYSAEQGRITVK